MKVSVCFIRYYTYHVEVNDELEDEEIDDAAIEKAEELFERDCLCPVADTTYDEVEIDW